MPRQSLRLIIFDLDGTLVDSRRDLASAVNFALRKLARREIDLQQVTRFVGDGIQKLVERAIGEGSPDEVEKGVQYFHHYYARHLVDQTRPYSGIRETLKHFSELSLAVLSNKRQDYVERILTELELLHFFDVVVGARPDLRKKPHPEALWKVLEQTKMQANAALIVGDSANDILAGQAAGIRTCAALYGFRGAAELLSLRPTCAIRQPAELISCVM